MSEKQTGLSAAGASYDRQIYDLQQMVEISRSLCTTLDINTLLESILYISMAQMRCVTAGVFLLDAADSGFYMLSDNFCGFELNPTLRYSIPPSAPIISVLTEKRTTFSIKQLMEKLPGDEYVSLLDSLEPSLIVPFILKNHLIGFLLLGERIKVDSDDDINFSDYEKDQICTIASLAAVAINNATLVEISSTDMMTHLKLKYYFFNVLTEKLDLCVSQGQTLGVLMFDVDFFKRINDAHGHSCGDYVLEGVARIIRSSIREKDMAARYGGEEFTVMLCNASKKDSLGVAERIRRNIENEDFFYNGNHIRVTVSCGVSVFSPDNNPVKSAKALVDQADQALYISKRNGKNMITYAEPTVLAAVSNGF